MNEINHHVKIKLNRLTLQELFNDYWMYCHTKDISASDDGFIDYIKSKVEEDVNWLYAKGGRNDRI